MKVVITSQDDGSNTRGSTVICNDKIVRPPKPTIYNFQREWSEDEILDLLGDKRFKQYQNGKYKFDLTKKEIFDASNDFRFYTPIK